MTATTSISTVGRDRLLRTAMRADAVISGLVGVVGIPLAGWLADISGTTRAFELTLSAAFVVYGVVVFALSMRPSVRRFGVAVIVANVVCTVAAVVLVIADVYPLTSTGVVLTLGSGVYTLIFAELQFQGLRRLKA